MCLQSPSFTPQYCKLYFSHTSDTRIGYINSNFLEMISPLPRLAFLPYLSSQLQDHENGVRPQPPTPSSARVEYQEELEDFTRRMEARHRRKSFSSIPRRSTESGRTVPKSCMTQRNLLSPEQARRPQPRSNVHTIPHRQPQVPASLSQSILPELEELESIEQTFQISSTSSDLSSPSVRPIRGTDDLASPRDTKPVRRKLPRSITYDTFIVPMRTVNPHQPSRHKSEEPYSGSSAAMNSRVPSPYPTLHFNPSQSASSLALSRTSSGQEALQNCKEDVIPDQEDDPRYVFGAQASQYWLGRYTTQLDRLRHCELIPPPSNKRMLQKARTSRDFDEIEGKLKMKALNTLQSFCRNSAASESLEKFMIDLRHTDHDLWYVSRSEIWREIHKPLKSRQQAEVVAHSKGKIGPRPRKFGETLPHGIFRLPNASKRQLSKSRTLNNLANADLAAETRSNLAPDRHERAQQPSVTLPTQMNYLRDHQIRAVSDGIPKAPIHFARLRSPIRPGLVSSHTEPHLATSLHRRTAEMVMPRSSIPIRSPTPKSTSIPDTIRAATIRHAGRIEAETGARVAMCDDMAGRPVHRFKKSESMKKLVDAGIREIKKMGHRSSTTSSTA